VSTIDVAQAFNNAFFEQLSTPGLEKRAEDAVTDFTRTKMREDGVFRKILPPVKISNEQIDRQTFTQKPCKVVDMEPGSPAALSIPFATLPMTYYIKGPRYLVTMDRITTPRFMVDVDELRTWIMDIRQVLSDNSIKDMLYEEDNKAFTAFNTMVGTADSNSSFSGQNHHATISDGITREGVNDALMIMPKLTASFQPATVVANVIFMRQLMKWGRDEMGGDMSGEVAKNGWTTTDFLGVKWIFSIKRALIPDNIMFQFADVKTLGKHYMFEDTVMHVKREAYLLDFFSYQTSGATWAHPYGMAKATFADV
jgi:hypothetical protein